MKTIYYKSPSFDATYNLALEQYLFETVPEGTRLFMLWQNANAIIIGKFQNAESEINAGFVKENNIQVVRRPSGGGAVYHDLGNINYTFITDIIDGEIPDFSVFCLPVIKVLRKYGVDAEVSGRNDICVGEKKVSGTAQRASGSRIMHHGAMLYDSNMEVLAGALRVSPDKYASRANISVRSRVANIKPLMTKQLSAEEFINELRDEILKGVDYSIYNPTEDDERKILDIRNERYGSWDWNYGRSPAYNVSRRRYFDRCGTIELCLDVDEGIIKNVRIYGDFFAYNDIGDLEKALVSARLEREALRSAIRGLSAENYFSGMTDDMWISFVLGEY